MNLSTSLYILVLLLCIQFNLARVGRNEDKENELLRSIDNLFDDFQPDVQDLCTPAKTFKFDDDCTVSFDTASMEPTANNHVYLSTACGDDDFILVTMDHKDGMPTHAVRMNRITFEWTELTMLPHHACLYTTIKNSDVDVAKLKQYSLDGHTGVAGGSRKLKAALAGDLLTPPFAGLGDRRLQTCDEYKVIRMDIHYDTRFCKQFGGETQEGAESYIASILEVMNVFYMTSPLCFKIEACNMQGFCSNNGDVYRNMVNSADTVCDGNSLLDKFQEFNQPGPPQGCDSTHLFYGGWNPFPDESTIGCALGGTLCERFSFAVNQIGFTELLSLHGVLVAHELGHSLSADHVSGNEQYIMEPSIGEVEQFKAVSINSMRDYVAQKKAEDPSCTSTSGDGGTPLPDPEPCNGRKFRLLLQNDNYADETSWELNDSKGNTVFQGSGYQNGVLVDVSTCLNTGEQYTFEIFDSYGDGICCEEGSGYFKIFDNDKLLFVSNGQYNGGETVILPGDNDGPSPSPSCVPLQLKIRTDAYGAETSFALKKGDDLVWRQRGLDNDQSYTYDECLDLGQCNILKIYDSESDGMDRPGKVVVVLDGERVYRGRNYGARKAFRFGKC